MSNNAQAKYVKCPFYRRQDANRIVCEGLLPKNTINVVFEDSKDKRAYMRERCNSIGGCRSCWVNRMLELHYLEVGDV